MNELVSWVLSIATFVFLAAALKGAWLIVKDKEEAYRERQKQRVTK